MLCCDTDAVLWVQSSTRRTLSTCPMLALVKDQTNPKQRTCTCSLIHDPILVFRHQNCKNCCLTNFVVTDPRSIAQSRVSHLNLLGKMLGAVLTQKDLSFSFFPTNRTWFWPPSVPPECNLFHAFRMILQKLDSCNQIWIAPWLFTNPALVMLSD